jgi:PTH1 family peptidyl-tRNA hydrolase
MWLVVGLGNPGRDYAGTRHNLGFEVVDRLARRWKIDLGRSGFEARYGKGTSPGGQDVVLLEPQTFMNLSGAAVLAAMQFYRVTADRLVVAVDDLALPAGEIRVRPGGSAGGHNGLIDIISRLGCEEVGRVRIGIGLRPANWAGRDYVLARPDGAERTLLDEAVARSAEAVEVWIERGVEEAMNRYNRPRKNGSSGPTEQG